MKHQCEYCHFWVLGDPKGMIGNQGVCTVLLVQTNGNYDRNRNTPFWARNLTNVTTSWEGSGCPTYKEKKTVRDLDPKVQALVTALEAILLYDQKCMYERCPDCSQVDDECTKEKRCKDVPVSHIGKMAKKALDEFEPRCSPASPSGLKPGQGAGLKP